MNLEIMDNFVYELIERFEQLVKDNIDELDDDLRKDILLIQLDEEIEQMKEYYDELKWE